ncbi:MAG TPA: LuxR C-terminal-related transcriptional regulator [Bryobacteraceae bacterium]|nr:LuxR C-terminal-related transcriptional regulator [Bryobacteraceae bacterium]
MAKSIGGLTQQQLAVLCLFVNGSDLDVIANQLGIQRLTAEFHLLSLQQKLGIATKQALIQFAKANGLCE